MSLKQYRNLDLFIFSILAMVSEFLGTFLLESLFSGFAVSFASLVAIIAIFRWGFWGGIVYVLSGIPMIFIYKEDLLDNLLYFVVGNSFIFIVPLFYRRSLNQIRDKTFSYNIFILLMYCSILIGKTLSTFVLGEPFLMALRAVCGSFLLTIVVSVIMLNLLKKVNGLITDMYVLIEESKTEKAYESRSENV